VDLDVFSLEPDEVTNIEGMSSFLVAFILFLHFFFRKSKGGFSVDTDLCEVIEPLIKSGHIAAFTNRNSEVRAISIDQFERRLRGARVNAGVEGEFRCREMTWRQGSTQQEGAAEGSDDEVAGGLRHLHTNQTLIQSASPVKTKLY
jgi:hypothetical protein